MAYDWILKTYLFTLKIIDSFLLKKTNPVLQHSYIVYQQVLGEAVVLGDVLIHLSQLGDVNRTQAIGLPMEKIRDILILSSTAFSYFIKDWGWGRFFWKDLLPGSGQAPAQAFAGLSWALIPIQTTNPATHPEKFISGLAAS